MVRFWGVVEGGDFPEMESSHSEIHKIIGEEEGLIFTILIYFIYGDLFD